VVPVHERARFIPHALCLTMRLLERQSDGHLVLRDFTGRDVPAYAILSHTWNKEEVTFQEVEAGTGKHKAGWKKIDFCAIQAGADSLQYFWVDTCCINKSSDAELSEAINSMYRWYSRASKCYVYLSTSPSVKCVIILSNRHGMRLSGQVNGSRAVGLSKSSLLQARLSSSLETTNDSVTRAP
jgi:Heterokaryon incompatibility protein (HET)